MDVNPKIFQVGSTISNIVESIIPVAEEKGIEIIERIPADLPQIETDEARIHQIFQNIIGNAVKFTEKGSVTVSAHMDSEKITVAVKDGRRNITQRTAPHL